VPDYTFDTPEPIDLRIRSQSGTVTVTATDTGTSTVEVSAIDDDARDLAEEAVVQMDGSGRRLTVEVPERRSWIVRRRRLDIQVTVPSGSALSVRTASAKTTATGRFSTAEAHTASGEILLDEVEGDVDAHCASGHITVNSGRTISAHTASGKIRIGHASGDVDVHCASGTVRIGVAEASVRAKTASGDITVDEASAGTVALSAASGDLRVGVRSGVVARLDLRSLSGRIRSELPLEDSAPDGGARLEIQAKATSGNVVVVPAPARTGA